MAADQKRKADTFRKIELGGLIIKAKLGDLERAVLLGLLCDAAERLAHPEHGHGWQARYKRIGDAEFATAQGRHAHAVEKPVE